MDKYKFDATSSRGDAIIDKLETKEYSVGLNPGTTGKLIKLEVWSKVNNIYLSVTVSREPHLNSSKTSRHTLSSY